MVTATKTKGKRPAPAKVTAKITCRTCGGEMPEGRSGGQCRKCDGRWRDDDEAAYGPAPNGAAEAAQANDRRRAEAQADEDDKRDAARVKDRYRLGFAGDPTAFREGLLGSLETRPDLRDTTLPSGIAANDPRANGKAKDGLPHAEADAARGREGHTDAFAGEEDAVEASVPLEFIDVSPWQPRQEFNEAEIEALAEDMRVRGQKDACNGRWVGDRVELTDGERRLRAAKLLQSRGVGNWDALRVRVGRLSDAQAQRDAALGNLFRENLNPLELAAAYKAWLTATGKTQQDLAELLKKDQGTISHALRLLELPEWARQEVMARRMSASHAREIGPWVKYPAIDQALGKIWKEEIKRHGEAESLGAWQRTVENVVENSTGPLVKDYHWDSGSGQSFAVKMAPTAEEREKLGLITVERRGKTEERATNMVLYQKLFEVAVKEARKKAKTREEKGAKGTKKGTGEKARTLTLAESKKRDRELAEQFTKRLQRWKCDWLAWLIAPRLNGSQDAAVTWRISLYLMTFQTEWGVEGATNTDESRRRDLFAELLGRSAERDYGGDGGGPKRFQAIRAAVDPVAPVLPVLEFLKALLWDAKENAPARLLPGYVIEGAAEDLRIDLATEWASRRMFAGPLTESYFNLHSKEQLADLGQEWGVFVDAGKPKATIIAQLLAGAAGRSLPRELAAIAPKTAKAPAKKAKAK